MTFDDFPMPPTYLIVAACPACGTDPQVTEVIGTPGEPLRATCRSCGGNAVIADYDPKASYRVTPEDDVFPDMILLGGEG